MQEKFRPFEDPASSEQRPKTCLMTRTVTPLRYNSMCQRAWKAIRPLLLGPLLAIAARILSLPSA